MGIEDRLNKNIEEYYENERIINEVLKKAFKRDIVRILRSVLWIVYLGLVSFLLVSIVI